MILGSRDFRSSRLAETSKITPDEIDALLELVEAGLQVFNVLDGWHDSILYEKLGILKLGSGSVLADAVGAYFSFADNSPRTLFFAS